MAKKFIPRPDYVVVGHRRYGIQWLTENEWREQRFDDGNRGLSAHAAGLIHLRLDFDGDQAREDMLREILLHEILHCATSASMVWNSWDLHSEHEYENDEEAIVGASAPWLLMILKQNPHVVAYLLDDQEHD